MSTDAAHERRLHIGDFAGREGQRFALEVAPGLAADAILVAVAEGPGASARNEQFSLTLRAPVDAPLEQRIYPLSHAELGRIELFLVPVGRDAAGVEYQAVFNRLIDGDGA